MQNIMKDVKEILETGKVGSDKGFKSWGSRIIARSLQDGWVYGAELRDLKEESETEYNTVIQILNKYNINIAEGRIKQMRLACETAQRRTKEEVLAELDIAKNNIKETGLLNNRREEEMTVKEFIKDKDSFIITRNGQILGIKNKGGNVNFGKNTTDTSFLNEKIKRIDAIKGMYDDVTGIRL